ncbi:MAG: DUF559 domain-containing protein [Oscillospiraceae bacterium]|nr:DUF559 domain-containing protein [Oscillospiraceae bacterium]
MGRNGTSLREQEVFFFVKKFFSDAVNRYKFKVDKKTLEVDIYIPSLKLVIEYDGSYWHKNKENLDNEKNRLLNELGLFVLRVREYGAPTLNEFYGHIIDLPYIHLNELNLDHINLTLEFLANKVEPSLSEQIRFFYVDEKEYKQALKYIYALRYPDIIEPNLSDMCGIEYWDKEVNYPLEITHVGKFDWVPAILICENKRELTLPRYYKRTTKQECLIHKQYCDSCCFSKICIFFDICHKENDKKISCKYVEDKVWEMIKNGETLKGFDGDFLFRKWLINESDIGDKILEKFFSYSVKSKKREDIAYFLGVDRKRYREMVKDDSFDIYKWF